MIRSQIASRFKRATTMGLLWAWLVLALHVWPGGVVPTHAQGTRKDDIVFNSRGVPLAGATVRVCTMPASGQPCTPLALIYSDSGLTQAIANPTTTDGLGNYFFYAAPGQYEIEVSGPGITTKQLPNVILPNDPSSPTFSGAISAFSLNLSGNLAVTGNTTVIGSLASGTLNLSNQGSPPGAASAGTVNLYTKTVDKRLYYKDDTGTEIGPISSGGSGAQLNVVNTFTATQNFDSDVETKGPNPNFSLSRYGGYSSATGVPPSTTGSINSGNTTLVLAAAQDFANGQGIVIYKAGPATALTTPGQPTITPVNLLNGTTTYNYRAIAEDRGGGLTAAGTAGSTTVGAATMGANSVTLTSCVRTSGVATYTSSSAHNLQSGAQVNIAGFGGGVFETCNGVKTIASTPTSTTFTTQDGNLANETNTAGSPTATVFACNTLTFPSGTYSGQNTIHYWIYRSIGAGSYSLVGVAQGVDPWWQDCGFSAPTAPPYVPATPPGSPQPGYLATTIASGGGTTTLTLANAAGTTASSQTVLHDNSVPLLNAVKAADNSGGGTVYIPNGGGASLYWVFNATVDFSALALSSVERIHVNSNAVYLNQPWVVHAGMDFEGEPHATTSFSYVNGGQMLSGSAYPMFLMGEWGDAIHFDRLLLQANQPQQSAIFADSASDGGGTAGIVFDDVDFTGNSPAGGVPVVLKGGFDYFFNRGNCQGLASSFTPVSCLQLTDVSPAVTASGIAQVPGRVKVNGLYMAGNAIDIDCLPDGVSIAPVDFTFNTTIFESQTSPYLRFNCPAGFFGGIELNDVVLADSRVGFGTPVIDAQNDTDIGQFAWTGGAVTSASMPALITPSPNASLLLAGAPFANPGNAPYTTVTGAGVVSTGILAAASPGRVETFITTPTGPSVAVSSGGSVPIGTIPYRLQWVDVDGNFSPVSPIINALTTTGNQTVTLSPPTAPSGAIFWVAYRSDAEVANPPFGCTLGYIPINSTYVDTASFTCGQSERPGTAGNSILGPNGLSGTQLRLVNNGNILTILPTLSANRTLTLPDVSGLALVTGYVNTAFDNFTRANGGLGSNWTTYSGLTAPTITGDRVVGNSGGSQSTVWNANAFTADQFSEIVAGAASDGSANIDPGVRFTSGVGGYVCLANGGAASGIWKIAVTTFTSLASATITYAAGDALRCEAQGSTITFYKNGVSQVSVTDTSFTSGSPGFNIFSNSSGAVLSNWSGGNLHPFAALDLEQSWKYGQHFDGNSASCTMSSATSCTATLTSATWHGCVAQVQGTSAIAAACSISGTTLTVTAASSNSLTWGIFLF